MFFAWFLGDCLKGGAPRAPSSSGQDKDRQAAYERAEPTVRINESLITPLERVCGKGGNGIYHRMKLIS